MTLYDGLDLHAHNSLIALALPLAQESSEEALVTQGWDDHGLFRNDPEALQLFDAIEEERNRHQVGDV
jgi:hypothetical protein